MVLPCSEVDFAAAAEAIRDAKAPEPESDGVAAVANAQTVIAATVGYTVAAVGFARVVGDEEAEETIAVAPGWQARAARGRPPDVKTRSSAMQWESAQLDWKSRA
jgi:hypothetical protein